VERRWELQLKALLPLLLLLLLLALPACSAAQPFITPPQNG
jgi:hypothetical protein